MNWHIPVNLSNIHFLGPHLVPISAPEGPHLVPISLKIKSPFGPHFEKFRSPFQLGAVLLVKFSGDSVVAFRPVSYTHLTLPTILRV